MPIEDEEEPVLLDRDPFQNISKTVGKKANQEKRIRAERIKNAFKENLKRSLIYRFGL